VGIIGDTHLPFERPDYLNFCVKIFDRCKCKTIVHIGDLVDSHSISFFEHDSDGKSPADEMKEVDKRLRRWIDCFPELYLCLGNHDLLFYRKIKAAGLPGRILKSFEDIWELPIGWQVGESWEFDGVRYIHGTGLSGRNAHIKAAELGRQSTVIGHTHSTGGQITYLVSESDRIWGMNVGCGIDRKAYAFQYGYNLLKKPVLGCGVVTDKGNYCQWFPMDL
jgi:predicted phosphodiesterase